MKKIYWAILSLVIVVSVGAFAFFNINSNKVENNTAPVEQSLEQKLQEESELLYTRVTQFLELNKNASPKEFEEICRKYIADNSKSPVVLEEKEFEKQSAGKMILYKGLGEENDVNEFKKGKIYISENLSKVRGSGIYTTSNKKVADIFTFSFGSVVRMFFSNDKDVKMIENPHMEQLKKIMCSNHSEEFGEAAKILEDYNLASKAFDDYRYEIIKDSKTDEEVEENLSKEGVSQKISELNLKASKIKEKFYKDKKLALLYNSGFLAKLLGYNVLHTDEFDKSLGLVGLDIEEYLVLDAGILTICK